MLFETMVFNITGPSWEAVSTCLQKGHTPRLCIKQHALGQCKKAKHKVLKLLRLSLDNMETFLNERDNLKVIHLVRDPRAILNSRIKTPWFVSKTKRTIRLNTQALCLKMRADALSSQRLLKKFPTRFRMVYYEDLTNEPSTKLEELYTFLGMSLDPSLSPDLDSMVNHNTSYWWRHSLQWSHIQYMDSLCKDVYNILGYRMFKVEADVRNVSIPSLSVDFDCK